MDYNYSQVKSIGMKQGYVLTSRYLLGVPGNILTYFIANLTKITPNQITIFSLILGGISALNFLYGNYIWGVIFYYISQILDFVDGSLARLTNRTSVEGKMLDYVVDIFVPIFVVLSISINQPTLTMVLLTYMISILTVQNLYSFSYKLNEGKLLMKRVEEQSNKNIKPSKLMKIRAWLLKRKIRSSISAFDTHVLVFMIAPLFGIIYQCAIIGTIAMTILFFLFLRLQWKVLLKEEQCKKLDKQ